MAGIVTNDGESHSWNDDMLFARKPDELGPKAVQMEVLFKQNRFEEAIEIRNELIKAAEDIGPDKIKSYQGLEQAIFQLKSHSIRIYPEVVGEIKFLNIAITAWKRNKDIVWMNICSWREAVAKAMVELGIDPPGKTRKYRGPNRAFLDVYLKQSPNKSSEEIKRREKVKLWKAIKSGDPEARQAAKEKLRELRS